MRDPIAYTYEADVHCEYCAKERFEPCEGNHYLVGEDSEGNEITPIHAFETTLNEDHDYSEGPNISACGTCGRIIEAQVHEKDIVSLYPFYSVSELHKQWHENKLEAVEEERDELKHELKQLKLHTRTLLVMIEDEAREIRSMYEIHAFAKFVREENWLDDDEEEENNA
jgi:hypothetical protein